jgi:TonB family protein
MARNVVFAIGAVAILAAGGMALARAPQTMPRDRTATEQGASERAGFERKVADLEQKAAQQPGDASAQHVIGTFYYEKSRDQSLSADQKRIYITRALAAEDKALQIKPDYVDALVYKNILLRTQATMETDPAVKDELIREADTLRTRALQLQSARAAEPIPEGTVVTPGPPPPPPPPPPGGAENVKWVYASTQLTLAGGTRLPALVKRIEPVYAPMVIASGIKGDVVLEAAVQSDGKVGQVRVLKTQPMLTQAAIDAVRQWQFDPKTVDAGTLVSVTATFVPPSH